MRKNKATKQKNNNNKKKHHQQKPKPITFLKYVPADVLGNNVSHTAGILELQAQRTYKASLLSSLKVLWLDFLLWAYCVHYADLNLHSMNSDTRKMINAKNEQCQILLWIWLTILTLLFCEPGSFEFKCCIFCLCACIYRHSLRKHGFRVILSSLNHTVYLCPWSRMW